LIGSESKVIVLQASMMDDIDLEYTDGDIVDGIKVKPMARRRQAVTWTCCLFLFAVCGAGSAFWYFTGTLQKLEYRNWKTKWMNSF